MKRIKFIKLLIVLLLADIYFLSAQTFDIYVANRTLTSNKTMEFDVFIKSNGTTGIWPLRSFQAGYKFNPGFINGGTISGSYIAGSSELTEISFGKTWGFSWNNTNKVLNQSANTGTMCPGALIDTIPRKIGRYRIINTLAWGCVNDDMIIMTPSSPGTGFLKLSVTSYTDVSCENPIAVSVTSGATAYTSSANQAALKAVVSLITPLSCLGNATVRVSATGGLPPYQDTGTFYRSSGKWFFSVTDSVGCISTDSITIDSVRVITGTSNTTADACESYSWNGRVYTASGIYTAYFSNNTFCDSAAYLNLTIKRSSSSLLSIAACDSFTWNYHTYLQSGNYSVVLTNANGCDSTANLNLSIIPRDTTITSITACTSYFWPFSGQTYTSSGSYYHTLDCNTQILNLTISTNYSVGGIITGSVLACPGNNSGTLTLSGNNGTVMRWEYSTDGGGSWTVINNSTYFQQYNDLSNSTTYRAVVKSGVCPEDYSSTAIVEMGQSAVGGIASAYSSSVCLGSNTSIILTGQIGNIVDWEISVDDGTNWSSMDSISNPINVIGIIQPVQYRAKVWNTVCYAFSSPAIISVLPLPDAGTITGNDTVCAGNSFTFTTNGESGGVWQTSNPFIASVNYASGELYPVSSGTVELRYIVNSASCGSDTARKQININACLTVINLKAYIQGFIISPNNMRPALYNSGVTGSMPTQADTLIVEIRDSQTGSLIGSRVKTLIFTDGTAVASFPRMSGSHYIVIRHRNSLETWSATPVAMGAEVNYDFTVAANKAYGSNMASISGGKFALWSGDVNQDGVIESADYAQLENDILSILFGYYSTDLTGDGVVESADYSLMDNNILRVIFVARPF